MDFVSVFFVDRTNSDLLLPDILESIERADFIGIDQVCLIDLG